MSTANDNATVTNDLTIMHPMVQMGNAPTAWTASTGDYLTANETKTEIKQTVGEIKLTASTSGTSSTIKLTAGGTEITSAQINLSGVVTFSDLSTWNQDKTIINGGNITTGQIHNKARTTTYDLDNAWIRMGKDAGTRVNIDTGRIRWYWENNLTGVLSSRYGKSYIGDNSRYTFLGWFSTGDPSFDYSTGGATSEFVGIAIDQVDKVIHCNASKFEIPGRIECGSLSVNGGRFNAEIHADFGHVSFAVGACIGHPAYAGSLRRHANRRYKLSAPGIFRLPDGRKGDENDHNRKN